MAEELDNKELEWICPNCVRQDTLKLAEAQQSSITQVKLISVAYWIQNLFLLLPSKNLPPDTTATESSLFYEGVRDEDIAEAIVEFLCKVGGKSS